MTFKIVFTSKSRKQLSKLNKSIQKKLIDYMESRVQASPFTYGKSLLGNKKGLWRYRIEDYRIICRIDKQEITILILEIGHRREVYD